MIESKIGEIYALMCAIFWMFCALAFESAGKKVGSFAVNFIRLLIGLFLLSLYTFFVRGKFLPFDATGHAWLWLSISGLIGFTVGDLLLFEAFVVMNARISMLIMALVPIITAFIGWLFLNETMVIMEIFGMLLTIIGIVIVILERNPNGNKINFSYPIKGILLAFGGALGQSVGLILSKFGMKQYDAFAATQIRVIAGLVGFIILYFFIRQWKNVYSALKNRRAMAGIAIGSVFGPFLGVAFSLLAIQNTKAGIASTIMAIVPLLIIPPAIILFKEKVNFKEIVGAFIAVVGVGIFFL